MSDDFIVELTKLFPERNVINDFEYALSVPEEVSKLPVN